MLPTFLLNAKLNKRYEPQRHNTATRYTKRASIVSFVSLWFNKFAKKS